MSYLIRPGLKFTADIIPQPPPGLGPTMSTYGYGWNLEGAPAKNEVYVICNDGSVMSVFEPERPIGWELLEEGGEFFFRVTQMNHKPQPCIVYARGYEPHPPKGRGKIGSVVTVCRPRNTEDEEIQSIARFDPALAAIAKGVNDPVQTTALAQFAEGKMSYAEMRGLCG